MAKKPERGVTAATEKKQRARIKELGGRAAKATGMKGTRMVFGAPVD
ncbi:MAG: hypothetical protein O2930_13420 [Acidobacteria bacterium]|nr:hypothetical protein [Acidobacteriota bacterium]